MFYKTTSNGAKYCEFYYVNDIGHPKKIQVFEKENGKYPFTLWDMVHGEWCGSGHRTPEELNDFFKHYRIDANVPDN